MKLATWNVALPVSARRREVMREHTDRQQADVWVDAQLYPALATWFRETLDVSAVGGRA